MRVAVLPGDNGGCGSYRLIEPADAVRKVRPDWQIRTYQPRGELKVGIDQQGRVVAVALDPLPDLIVMQRTGTPLLAGVVQFLQARGVAVVVDFDDAMWCIDRDNVAYAAWNQPQRHRGQHWAICDSVARRADLVTVTTPTLARHYAPHGRVEVLPNRIPDRFIAPRPAIQTEIPIAGWSGYTATHPGDCQVSAPAAQIFNEHGLLRVMADPVGAASAWGVPREDVVALPSQNLDSSYYDELAKVGVMLVGLRDSKFNHSKSTLKVLEAAAAGIPSIASATKPHRELARDFPLMLAHSPTDWRDHARSLLDRGARETAAEAVVVEMPQYSMSSQAEAWAQAWERAANRRGGKKA